MSVFPFCGRFSFFHWNEDEDETFLHLYALLLPVARFAWIRNCSVPFVDQFINWIMILFPFSRCGVASSICVWQVAADMVILSVDCWCTFWWFVVTIKILLCAQLFDNYSMDVHLFSCHLVLRKEDSSNTYFLLVRPTDELKFVYVAYVYFHVYCFLAKTWLCPWRNCNRRWIQYFPLGKISIERLAEQCFKKYCLLLYTNKMEKITNGVKYLFPRPSKSKIWKYRVSISVFHVQ